MAIIELIETLAPWELINTFIIPAVLIFAILWGTLTAMKIFNKKINGVLALGIVLFLMSTGFFPMISMWMMQLGSFVAVGAFLLVFVVGVIVWGANRTRGIYYDTTPYKERERIIRKIADYQRKIAETGDVHKKVNFQKEIEELDRKLKVLEAESRR